MGRHLERGPCRATAITGRRSSPFHSSRLQYNAGEDVTWGVNFMRTRTRNLEISTWAGPLAAEFRISQAGTLVELHARPPSDRLAVIPYAQATFEQAGKRGVEGRAATCASR